MSARHLLLSFLDAGRYRLNRKVGPFSVVLGGITRGTLISECQRRLLHVEKQQTLDGNLRLSFQPAMGGKGGAPLHSSGIITPFKYEEQ